MTQPNNRRFDLSEQLIHFFRDVDHSSDRPTDFVADFGSNNFVADDESQWPALFLLRCAVRSLRLWATWSIRNGRRGVFGPRPAVCFSEMPLAVFLETSERREAWAQAMSGYGLTFPRDGMFELGARPAIYGLSRGAGSLPAGEDGSPRIMPEGLLPVREQYRFVPTNPVGKKPIDWLHKREWRWPFSSDLTAYNGHLESFGHIPAASEMPHLDLSGANTKGMGIIVKTSADGNKLAYDVLTLVDRELVWPSHFAYILVRDQLPKARDLYRPKQVSEALAEARLDIKNFIRVDKKQASSDLVDFASKAMNVEESTLKRRPGGGGECWLWFLDNAQPYVRSLLHAGRIKVNKDGKYLADLREFDGTRGRLEREAMAQRLARRIKSEHGLDCCYYSILEGDDPDDERSFYPDRLDNEFYFNRTDYGQ